MTIVEKIINLFNTPTCKYKGVPVNCFGLPILSTHNKQSVQNAFNRLRKQGYIQKDGSNWKLIKNKNKIPRKKFFYFDSPFKKDAPKNLLLMFDIPEKRRKDRDWLRRQLHCFGYVLFQKSIWIGPSPLPKDFINYMKEIKLWDKIDTFKLAKPFTKNQKP